LKITIRLHAWGTAQVPGVSEERGFFGQLRRETGFQTGWEEKDSSTSTLSPLETFVIETYPQSYQGEPGRMARYTLLHHPRWYLDAA
jgi:hypothetical protein